MAQIIIHCPHCGQQLSAQSEWIGQQVKCTVCERLFTVSQPDTEPRDTMQEAPKTFIMQCPHCKQQLTTQSNWIGQQTKCPFCSSSFTISHPDSKKENSAEIPHDGEKEADSEEMSSFIIAQPEKKGPSGHPLFSKPRRIWITAASLLVVAAAAVCTYFLFIKGNGSGKTTVPVAKSAPKTAGSGESMAGKDRKVPNPGKPVTHEEKAETTAPVAPSAPAAPASRASDKIPFAPKFEGTFPFSWKSASAETIQKWCSRVLSDKKSNGKRVINAEGKDGVQRSFQFDSAGRLSIVICKVDIADSTDITGKLNRKYNTSARALTSTDSKTLTTAWYDKDSDTQIKIVTLTNDLTTFVLLSPKTERPVVRTAPGKGTKSRDQDLVDHIKRAHARESSGREGSSEMDKPKRRSDPGKGGKSRTQDLIDSIKRAHASES